LAKDGQSTGRVKAPRGGQEFLKIADLGVGGMAHVSLSASVGAAGFSKLVVLKTMRRELVAEATAREMFLAEARLSARLNHPNVVQVYDVIANAATPSIVMEYLDGQPLSALLTEFRASFGLANFLEIMCQVLDGLQYSHDLRDLDGSPLNIVHRDVSPQNVFVTYEGAVKVLDFGIAKAADASNATKTGIVKGKLHYMPPEQLVGLPVDRRADVFAVGCILWDICAGEKLWGARFDGDVMRSLLDGKIPAPSSVRETDPEFEAIVMRALSPELEKRHASASDLHDDLRAYMQRNGLKSALREAVQAVGEHYQKERSERSSLVRAALSEASRGERTPEPVEMDFEDPADATTEVTARRKSAGAPAWRWAGLGVVVLFSSLIAFAYVRSTPLPAAPSASALPGPTTATLTVRAKPSEAKLLLDGAEISGNPAELRLLADGREHVVSASLEGYVSESKRVTLVRDHSVEFALERAAKPAAQPSASAKPADDAQPPAPAARIAGRRERPAAETSAGTTAEQPPAAPPVGANCNPPYFFEKGIKVYREGCF
jgi:serine/threonine-protein kinase